MAGTSDLKTGLDVVASLFTVFTTIFGLYKGYAKFLSPTSRLGGTENLIAEIEQFLANLNAEERMRIDRYLHLVAGDGGRLGNINVSIASCSNALETLEILKLRQTQLQARAIQEEWIASLNPLREMFTFIKILSTDLQQLNNEIVITTAEARKYYARLADSESPLHRNGGVNIGEQNNELETTPMALSLIPGAVDNGHQNNQLGTLPTTLPQIPVVVNICDQSNELGTPPMTLPQTPGSADVGETIDTETSTYESAYGSSIYESAPDDVSST